MGVLKLAPVTRILLYVRPFWKWNLLQPQVYTGSCFAKPWRHFHTKIRFQNTIYTFTHPEFIHFPKGKYFLVCQRFKISLNLVTTLFHDILLFHTAICVQHYHTCAAGFWQKSKFMPNFITVVQYLCVGRGSLELSNFSTSICQCPEL